MALSPGRILTQGLGSFGSASHLLTLGFGFAEVSSHTPLITRRLVLTGTSQQRLLLVGTSQQRVDMEGASR